jgi:lysine/ornithine N-monooxygenase
MAKKSTKTLFPDKSAGHYPALILLWAGAFVIFLIMIALWYREGDDAISLNVQHRTTQNRPASGVEEGIFVDELLLSANDLSISGRKELINTLLTNNNEYDTVSSNTFAGRDKIYKKLYEQQVKNTNQNRTGGGIDIRPVP